MRIDTPTVDAEILLDATTPAAPAASSKKIYVKADGFFYRLDSSGREVRIGTGAKGQSPFTNFLTNGDFEQGGSASTAVGWTASAGTLAAITTAANLYAGQWSGSWTPNAAADTLINTAFVITSGGGPSGNGAATIMYKTASALHTLQVLDGATVLNSVLLPANTAFTPATLNFGFPASSTGINIRILAGDNTVIYLDEAFLGDARAVNLSSVSQASFFGSAVVAGTTSCVWSATSTTYVNFGAQAACPVPTVTGKAQAPGTKIPGITFASLPPGDYYIVANGFFNIGTTGAVGTFRFTDGTTNTGGVQLYNFAIPTANTLTGHFTYTTAQTNVTFQLQGAASSGIVVVVNNYTATVTSFELLVYYFPASSQLAVTPDTTEYNASYYLSANSSASHVPFDTKIYDTQSMCTAGASFVCTAPIAGKYLVTGNFSSSGAGGYQIIKNGGFYANTNSTPAGGLTQTYAITISLAKGDTVYFSNPNTQTITGGVLGSANTSIFSITNISQSIPAPILMNQVTTSAAGGIRTEYANVTTACTSTPCTIASQSGAFSSISRAGTGSFVLNFVAGTFSAPPICAFATNAYTVNPVGLSVNIASKTAIAVPFNTYQVNGSAQDTNGMDIICVGPK